MLDPIIPVGVVQAWRISVPNAPINELAAVLSAEERERSARFAFDRDRNQFIVVRGCLRKLLGRYLERSPEDIRFAFGPQGKPRLADGDSDICFNVSHSSEIGVLAFCRGREIGVDVERVERRVDTAALARSCFSSTELKSLQSLADDEQLARFFQLWTAKEAYIKALGGGLSIPLKDFTIDVRPDSDTWSITTFPKPDDRPIQARRIPVPPGYAGAVAVSGSDWTVDIADV